jgi:hypothetical protein
MATNRPWEMLRRRPVRIMALRVEIGRQFIDCTSWTANKRIVSAWVTRLGIRYWRRELSARCRPFSREAYTNCIDWVVLRLLYKSFIPKSVR